MSAQTYTVLSRDNDSIRLQPNKLGDAIKSAIPGQGNDSHYWLIQKEDKQQKTYVFVELVHLVDRILVAYETDAPGKWNTTTYGVADLYNALKRESTIYLSGQILGLRVEMFQRPDNFKDIIRIDGIEFPSPIKLNLLMPKNPDEQKRINNMYLATLIKTNKLNTDMLPEIEELFDYKELKRLASEWTLKDLQSKSTGYDQDLKRFSLDSK